MPLHLIKHYTRELIRTNPDALFVFGDNMYRAGYGGQAAQARNEPNTIGIPTLWAPNHPFTDADWDNPIVQGRIIASTGELVHALDNNVHVFWPSDGIGTGFANLANNAPRIWRELEAFRLGLFKEYKA